MKTKLLFFSLVLLALGGSLFGQTLTPAGSSTGSITTNAANCNTTNACIILHLASSNVGYSVTASGTWTGTLTVEQSGDNQGSWTSATTTTANTLYTSALTPGITDVRVRGSAAMTGTAVITITASGPATLQQITQAGGSSSSSPSSLSTYFNRYYGLAPQDYGAKGDTHIFGDCGMTAAVAVVNCTGSHFTSADCQTGTGCTGPANKQYDTFCPGGAASPVTGTITSFISATSVGVSVACSNTVTNQYFGYGTDDTTALLAWVAAMLQPAVNGVPPISRGGYIPQGGYWTTKPLRFVSPGGAAPQTGECGPNAGTPQTLPCSLWIQGQGSTSTYIYAASTFNWSLPTTGSNTGVMYFSQWAFPNFSNFAIIALGEQFNVTANTGVIGALVLDQNSHANVANLWIQGFHNTGTDTLAGIATAGAGALPGDFESSYYNIATESNGMGWIFNPLATGGTVYEKILLDTIYVENNQGGGNAGQMQINSSTTLKQFHWRNIHFLNSATVDLNVRTSVVINNGDAFICDECRVTTSQGADLGIVLQSAGRYSFPEFYFENLNSIGSSVNAVAFTLQNGATLGLAGGAIDCVSCTNAINLSSGSPSVYAVDLTLTNPTNHANFTRGTGTVNAFLRTATGWDGPSVIQSTIHANTQGAALVNGNVVASAGWGNTAAVTASAGIGPSSFRFTVTASGTGQAANPTLTITLPNAWPTATTTCHLTQSGGTGAFTMMLQTTLSATVPVFTLQGTPTAAATYIYDGGCGP